MYSVKKISLVAGLVLTLGFAAGWSRPNDAADEILPLLGLKFGELITIDQEQLGKSEMAITMDGQDYVIDYRFFSIRSKNFRLMVQQEDGEIVEQVAPAVSTIRGTLRDVEGSQVIGCINENGCCAMIKMPSGENCYLEPVSKVIDDPAFAGLHVVYSEDDVLPSGGRCGTVTNLAEAQEEVTPSVVSRSASSNLLECELILDADFEYFSVYGTVSATLDQMEMLINIVNNQYETEVGIRHTITNTIVRCTPNDPYMTSDGNVFVDEVENFYRGTGIDGDVCHVFTGKSNLFARRNRFDPNSEVVTINGIAARETICTATGISITKHQSSMLCTAATAAHELGHNWAQRHCDCFRHTMYEASFNFLDFHDTLTVPNLIAYRDTLNCLEPIGRIGFGLTGDPNSSNDDLANAEEIGLLNFSINGTNTNATTEAGEPELVEVGSTVWCYVDAEENGTYILDTFGSDFDTQLHIYRFVPGGGLAGLVPLDNDDDTIDPNTGSLRQSQVTFDVTAGNRYEIRAGGYRNSSSIGSGSEGNIVLNGAFTPSTLLGDVNRDGLVDFLDISPFISILTNGEFQAEADFDQNGIVNFLDISPFIVILSGP